MQVQVSTVYTNGMAVNTGPYMHHMVERYWRDMLPWAHLTLDEIFSLIKSIPFRPDPEDEETLMRPAYTMARMGWGGDCDDKCIALAAWARINRIPYRFVAVRRPDMPTLHHVVCDLFVRGKWIHADPTYSFNTLGREREKYVEHTVI